MTKGVSSSLVAKRLLVVGASGGVGRGIVSRFIEEREYGVAPVRFETQSLGFLLKFDKTQIPMAVGEFADAEADRIAERGAACMALSPPLAAGGRAARFQISMLSNGKR